MAEIQTPETRKRKGVRRSIRNSTRVDLTPMVDLGFLLITFFVFNTSIAKPTVMNLSMPDSDNTDSMTLAGSKTLNLLLAANNTVYYYDGNDVNKMKSTDLSPRGVREVIRSKKRAVQQKYGDANETVVLIKPTHNAYYSNIIDVLDEIQINAVKGYVLMDAGKDEENSLFKH